jgi:hypothetical protein
MKRASMKAASMIRSRSRRSRRNAIGESTQGRTPRRRPYDREPALYILPFMLAPSFDCLIRANMAIVNNVIKFQVQLSSKLRNLEQWLVSTTIFTARTSTNLAIADLTHGANIIVKSLKHTRAQNGTTE